MWLTLGLPEGPQRLSLYANGSSVDGRSESRAESASRSAKIEICSMSRCNHDAASLPF